MSLHNLATVFGPTLLRPAVSNKSVPASLDVFSAQAHDAMTQTGILFQLISSMSRARGVDTQM